MNAVEESPNKPAGLIESRRHIVFAWAVFIASLVLTNFCLTPLLYPGRSPVPLFNDAFLEELFYDMFAVGAGCWLFCWVAAVNGWRVALKAGQWLGITLLSVNQALFLGVWWDVFQTPNAFVAGVWAVPWLVQSYLLGCFVALFTLPALTSAGNLRLTGLGTLSLVLPWLVGRKEILMGTQVLNSELLNLSKNLIQ
jgi:hypothetical protein